MDEQLEAERFCSELDKLLAGGRAAPAGEDEAQDLEFAGRLARLDLSRQSRVKSELKAALMAKAKPARFARLMPRRGFVIAVGVALAALFLIPAGVYYFMMPEYGTMASISATGGGGGYSGGGVFGFGFGSSPYEGAQGLAPGGAVGGAGDSLSYVGRQASNAAPGGAEMHPMEMASFRKLFQDGKANKKGQLSGVAAARGAGSALAGGAELVLPSGSQPPPVDREGYASITENPFTSPKVEPLSTFSVDVDAASYANVRGLLNGGALPPADAVRIEEFINYFSYKYPEPSGEHPFSIAAEVAACPWEPEHKLVRIGLKAKSIPVKDLPPSSLTFLVDTSGSMDGPDRLGLVQAGLRLLVEQLRPQDRVAIVAYAGSAGLVLPSTKGSDKSKILAAIEALRSGGSTAGGQGIVLAYKTARENFLKKGNNRVILATDGDFNVGVSSDGELVKLIEKEREDGVYLTVLGVGRGNYQDAKMEQLADKGNGNFAYLDDIMEARRVLVKEMGGTLVTLAKDVKLQVEFNPALVQAYRLVGYENRMLAAQDFNDDRKDAGEMGAGHAVTALYEVVPPGVKLETPGVDPLKYQTPCADAPEGREGRELLSVKFRYKKPAGGPSLLLSRALADETRAFESASEDFRWAASAAGFGLVLRGSKHRGDLGYRQVRGMAAAARGADEDGLRAEMIRLVEKAELLSKERP